jgi:phage terminase small subunit
MPRKSPAAAAFLSRTATRIRPPDDLTGPERQAFVDLVLACRSDHFQPSDAPLLAAYCRAVVLEKAASAGLAEDRYVMRDGKSSGCLNVLAQATRIMSTFSRMLRLNPAGRQTMPPQSAELAPPVSYYERMTLEAKRDDAN